MAEAATELLVRKIISALENEAALIGSVRDELIDMRHELRSMKAFLEDADRKTTESEGEKTWVANVTDMAYDVEDLMDEFFYNMNRPQGDGRFTRLLHKTVRLPKYLWARHRIATKLRGFNKMIKAIPERQLRYGVDHIEGPTSQDNHKWITNLQQASLFSKDDELVGVDDDKEMLVRWLTDHDPQRAVMAVAGMGGLGKTTLVSKAFNNKRVRQHFNCFAWITVSQSFNIENLLRNMVKEFFLATKELIPPELSSMSYKELVEKLVNYLEQKKYVIVLDDVWDAKLWSQVKVALPDGRHGSRILLTTRNEAIATFHFGDGSHFHQLKTLKEGEAWYLFCKKAFPKNHNNSCPPELKTIALELVKKCGGLPLAIVALGGVVSFKKSIAEWKQILKSLNWQLNHNELLEASKKILWLSYTDLSYRLKQCFLYCCLFPEDYPIRRRRLIRLWIAEGFAEEIKIFTPEEVAENYLMELISRSMLQVVMRNPSGKPETCKMHDFLREIALSARDTGNFCVVHDGPKALEECGARRLSIQSSGLEMKSCKGISQLRSFFLFTRSVSPTLPSGFKYIRVLDVKDTSIEKLPDQLANLFNLRYLNLKRTRVKELPKSIGKLRNLQTLDIRDTQIEVLPAGVSKLQNLRHLIMYRYNRQNPTGFEYVYGTPAPSNVCKLINLQGLMCVAAEEDDIMRRIGCLTQLTRIGITKLREGDEVDMCNSIQNMKLLGFLFVMVKNEEQLLRMDALTSPPPYLNALNLVGKLERVPHWFSSLENLVSLYLHWSKLEEDPLPSIQDLPNLGRLILINAYDGHQLRFVKGFNKLTVLHMKLARLNEIIVEIGVMPALQRLNVFFCRELKSIQGIGHLYNLQESYLPSHMEAIRGIITTSSKS